MSHPFKNSINTELKLPFNFSDVEDDIYISASLGTSNFPENGKNSEKLLEAADIAMYEDKRNEFSDEAELLFYYTCTGLSFITLLILAGVSTFYG